MSAFVKKHPVLTYYLLTFAISWGLILIAVGPVGFVTTTATSPRFALVGLASLLGPSVAGVLVIGIVEGRVGFQELLSRLLRWRVGARWIAVALLTGPLVTVAVLLALSLTSPAFLPAIVTAENKANLLWLGIGTGLIVSPFEEVGWTGLATPRLLPHRGVLATGLIMGLLWGAWHFPLFAGSASDSGALPSALFLGAMLFSWLVPYRVLMVWVYNRTASLAIAILMHLPIVVSQYVLTPEAISGGALFVSLIAYGAALWLVVALIALFSGGRLTLQQKAQGPRPA